MAPYGYSYPAAAPLVHGESSVRAERNQRRRDMNYRSLDEVSAALSKEGLKASKLLFGIDFTRSNEWTEITHDRKCLALTVIIHLAMVLKKLCPATERLLKVQNLLVTRSSETGDKDLSPQEEETLKSIVNARSYPLSIVVVRVGDGPWEDMKNFGDKLCACECHNFKMDNFTEIMSTNATSAEKEITSALAALMEIPFQYKAAVVFELVCECFLICIYSIGKKTYDRKSRANRSTPSTSSANLSALFVLRKESWPLAVGT